MSRSVEIILRFGSYTAPRCQVDEFEPDEVTVTDEHDQIRRVFRSGEWLRATQHEDGHPVHWFVSQELAARTMAAAEQLKQRQVA